MWGRAPARVSLRAFLSEPWDLPDPVYKPQRFVLPTRFGGTGLQRSATASPGRTPRESESGTSQAQAPRSSRPSFALPVWIAGTRDTATPSQMHGHGRAFNADLAAENCGAQDRAKVYLHTGPGGVRHPHHEDYGVGRVARVVQAKRFRSPASWIWAQQSQNDNHRGRSRMIGARSRGPARLGPQIC